MTTSSKEQFFRDVLVPAGQTVEVLKYLGTSDYQMLPCESDWVKAPRLQTSRDLASWAGCVLYEPLHVAAVYTMTSDGAALPSLAQAINQWTQTCWALVLKPGVNTTVIRERLLSWMTGRPDPTPRARSPLLRTQPLGLQMAAALKSLEFAVTAATGYSPAMRSTWFNTHQFLNLPGVMANGEVSGWRSLVRNSPWTVLEPFLPSHAGTPH